MDLCATKYDTYIILLTGDNSYTQSWKQEANKTN